MWKKIVAGLLVLAVVAVAVFRIFFFKSELDNMLSNKDELLSSYKLTGTMEMLNGEEVRNYNVEVSYKKGEEENFKVQLFDSNIEQLQLILRNDEGVYVLTPNLNQVHKFKGDWPLNTPKPYLYQSMINGFEDEHDLQTLEDGYLLTFYPEFKNSLSWYKQVVKFDKKLNPVFSYIYDKNDLVKVKFNVSSFERNITFDDDYFNVEKVLEDGKTTSLDVTTSFDDLPLYPANAIINATLKDQTVANIYGDEVFILAYDGEQPFTIVQKLLKSNDEIVFNEVEGELVDLMNGIGIINENQITCIYNGVEYRIYSDELSVAELIEIANGMEVVVTKE